MTNLKYMDFCSGIGAGRLGIEFACKDRNIGAECVGFSEINSIAVEAYKKLHISSQKNEHNYGDLMLINANQLPNFDLLIAGFPCQTFSIVGERAGFEDERGQVIYGISKIIEKKKPKFFLLENVKGLENHEQGKTLKEIIDLLTLNQEYVISYKVLDSLNYGVPQMRERIYIIGIHKSLISKQEEHPYFDWKYVNKIQTPELKKYLIEEYSFEMKDTAKDTFQKYLINKYNNGCLSIEKILELPNYSILDTRQSDLRIYQNKVPTLRAGRHGLYYVKNGKILRLTGIDALLLQGFPLNLSENLLHFQENRLLTLAGNAMTVTTIQQIVKNLINFI